MLSEGAVGSTAAGAVMAGQPPLGSGGRAQETGLQVQRAVRRRDVARAVELEAAEIDFALRAERQALDAIVAPQSPARPPHAKLPRRLREVTDALCELPKQIG